MYECTLCTVHTVYRVLCSNLNFESIKIAASISILDAEHRMKFYLIFHVIYSSRCGAMSVNSALGSRGNGEKEIK